MREAAHANGLRTWRFDLDGPDLVAAVTTRPGGTSVGPYAGCNLAFHVGDEPEAVLANRALVCDALGVDRLTVGDQQHDDRVVVIDRDLAGAGHASLADAEARLPSTDALVTDVPGVALAILVADCAPVVLHDPIHRALGVAHAGRRGAALDVLATTVATMAERYGSDPRDLRAGVGPCVGAASYELGGIELDEVRAAFGDELLRPTRLGHATFDLPAAVVRCLVGAGIGEDRIEVTDVDTRTSTDTWYSDRAERPCGRFALVAALRERRLVVPSPSHR